MHLSEIADPDIAEVTRLASLLPTSSTPSSLSPPSQDLHVTRSTILPSVAFSITCTCGIARSDTKLRPNFEETLPYLGSSRITIRSLDLLGNLRTFLLWLRSLLGSLRIYFGSSLDLSDSTLILEIGPSLEILRISRPFTHPVPLPFPLPSSCILPIPFLPLPLGCLLIFSLTWPSSFGRPSALFLRPSP